jgi:hypothetical protein
VAGASTAICRHYEIALGRKFADSELIKAVIRTAKIAKPYEPKYDDCYAFILCDNYLFKLTPNVTTRSEGSLLSAASHLMQRFSWGRGSEWRSFNRDRVKLYTEQSADPTATDSFENATRMVLTLLGTKNGKGLQKESPPITIHRVRQGVVGDEAARALDVFAVLGELERRYAGRDVGPRLDSRYAKASANEHARYGDGFFLSTKPEKTTGKYYYLSASRIRSLNDELLRQAQVPAKYTGHATRHAAESLLLDAGVPERQVARQARHNKDVMNKVYRHPSDDDHAKRARLLYQNVVGVTPQELLACARTPLARCISPSTQNSNQRRRQHT